MNNNNFISFNNFNINIDDYTNDELLDILELDACTVPFALKDVPVLFKSIYLVVSL